MTPRLSLVHLNFPILFLFFFFTIAYNTNITYTTKASYNTNVTYNTYITYNTNITYATTDLTYNTTVTHTTITTNTTITQNNYYRCSAYTTDNTNLTLHCTLITQLLFVLTRYFIWNYNTAIWIIMNVHINLHTLQAALTPSQKKLDCYSKLGSILPECFKLTMLWEAISFSISYFLLTTSSKGKKRGICLFLRQFHK